MKVVVDDKIPFIRGQVERLADEVVYLPGNAIGKEDVHDADALIIRTRTHCNRQLLEGSSVRFIATATIGYDHLDTDYLHEAGIEWTNSPGCNATSVAQYVRNALLEAEKAGIIHLSDATLGIIGYGHVGKAVANAMLPYVKQILINDPPLFENEQLRMKDEQSFIPHSSRITLHASLEALQTSCDIITLHTPLTFDGPYPTHHLLDEKFLGNLPHRPLLINAARGGVVCEEALIKALDNGHVRAAIIDTWEGEPDINLELLKRTFIGTPHIAGYSADGKANATHMVLEALSQWVCPQKNDLTFNIQPPEAAPERTGFQYSPLADSALLEATPTAFEQLRGNYPLRREKTRVDH